MPARPVRAGTLTQRHGRLIGTQAERVESVWPRTGVRGDGVSGATGATGLRNFGRQPIDLTTGPNIPADLSVAPANRWEFGGVSRAGPGPGRSRHRKRGAGADAPTGHERAFGSPCQSGAAIRQIGTSAVSCRGHLCHLLR
jgi:hypothetical protein